MNRKSMKAVATAVALAGVMAVGASAASSNVVGYIEIEVAAGGLGLLTVPFNQPGGAAHTLSTAFPTMPDGTELWVYTYGNPGSWATYTFVVGMGWVDDNFDDASAVAFARGTGFWLKNTSGSPIQTSLRGQVSDEEFSGTLQAGVQLVSYGFPTDADASTDGPATPLDGDELYEYAGGTTWTTYTFVDGLGWVDENFDPVAIVLKPESAYWYKAMGSVGWTRTPNFTL